MREALDLVPDLAKGDATLWFGHLCQNISSSMGAGPIYVLGFSQEKTPCVATLHRVFKGLDVAAFEAEVGNWLANSGVEADDPLSLDGKTLRGVHGQEIPGVHLVSATLAALGQFWAGPCAGQRGRIGGGQRSIGPVPLKGRVVVALTDPTESL